MRTHMTPRGRVVFPGCRWWSAMVLCVGMALAADTPVESETYLTGAWFAPRTAAERELYLKGGFTLVQHTPNSCDWAAENGLKFIGAVSSRGLPPKVARPFQEAGGAESMSVGLFTHINFNAPSVAAWWETRVPELVRSMPHAEHVRFWKVHNEFGYHSSGIYDYSPGSIAKYRAWLASRYEDIADLNRKWSTDYSDFDRVEPPRTRPEMLAQLGNWLEWRRFTCWKFADYFRSSGDLIRTVVPGAPVSDNYYTTSPLQGWDNFELARQTDFLGYDLYEISRWDRLRARLDHARCGAAAWKKPFVIIEYHAGPNNWITEVTHRDLVIEATAALARECRAIQWFRWIPSSNGREQGIHGMMDSQGRPTERFTAAAEVSAFCQRLAPLLHRSRSVSRIALLTSSDSAYLAYASRQSIHASRNRWDRFHAVLAAAGLQCDEIDPTVLVDGDLGRYKAIVAGHLRVLSEEARDALDRFARQGGTLVFHPEVAERDAFGGPLGETPYTEEAIDDGPWRRRVRRDGGDAVVASRVGQGHVLQCAWEFPTARPDPDDQARMGRAYRNLLREHAGVVPAWTADGVPLTDDLDTRVLDTGTGTLVFASWTGEGSPTVVFTLPGVEGAPKAYLLSTDHAAVTPLDAVGGTDGLTLDPVRLDPAAVILVADRPWQPLVGMEAPKVIHPGDPLAVTATLDNLAAVPVSGYLSLDVPVGWMVLPGQPSNIVDLAPGARYRHTFQVRMPPDTPVDHFGIDHQMVVRAVLQKGMTGSLSARHLPKVLPPLDLRVSYDGRELNPWQEMSPPILRWGWDREVRIPPPPPLAIRADCTAALRVRAAPDLVGKTLRLSLEGLSGATVSPPAIVLDSTDQTLAVRFRLPGPGNLILTGRCGETVGTATLQSGVHKETVAAALEKPGWLPEGWGRVADLAVGAREAGARGLPVSFELDRPLASDRRLTVFDANARPVAACVGGASVTVAADLHRNGVVNYTLAEAPAGEGGGDAVRRVRIDQLNDGTVVVHGDAYSLCMDTDRGFVRWIEIGGQRSVIHRTGLVATAAAGPHYEPGTDEAVTGMALAGSAVQTTLELTRRQRELETRESWSFTGGRIDVEVRISNRGHGPLALSGLSYELGIDPETLPVWRRGAADGRETTGRLPQGFGPARGAMVMDFTDRHGSGLALSLGRCALITKWQMGFTGVRHGAGRTTIGLFRGVRLDPNDTILAEFVLIPHGPHAPVVETPLVVTAVRNRE